MSDEETDPIAYRLEGIATDDGAAGKFGRVRWTLKRTDYGYRVRIDYPDGTSQGGTYHHEHVDDIRRDIANAHRMAERGDNG